jgi:hypothetical protein
MSQKHLLEPLSSVAKGENPKGFVAQTPNETIREGNSEVNSQGYPYDLQADGPRWNAPMPVFDTSPVAMPARTQRKKDKRA